MLEDYSTGKRRLLSHTTEQAARQRANKIRAAMVKGQASRMTLSNGEWQDVCAARKIIRGMEGGSLTPVAQEWADCRFRLPVSASLMDAVQFYMSQ